MSQMLISVDNFVIVVLDMNWNMCVLKYVFCCCIMLMIVGVSRSIFQLIILSVVVVVVVSSVMFVLCVCGWNVLVNVFVVSSMVDVVNNMVMNMIVVFVWLIFRNVVSCVVIMLKLVIVNSMIVSVLCMMFM